MARFQPAIAPFSIQTTMIVTFDTNGYRKLIENLTTDQVRMLVADIKRAEKDKGIKPMMSPLTAMELLSHMLDDESSRSYQSCRKAVIAIYGHCGDEKSFNLLPSPQAQISLEYFGTHNKKAEETAKALGIAAFQIWKKPQKSTVETYRDTFDSIKRHVSESENCLIEEIKSLGRKIDPGYTDWNLFVNDQEKRKSYLNFVRSPQFARETALAMLCAVHIQIADIADPKHLDPEVLKSKVDVFIKSYDTAINLRRFFFEQILNPGFDLSAKSRANYLWDEQILYFVGHTINSEKILLVTGDKKMHEAAKKSNLSNSVANLASYLDMLGMTAR